MSIIRFSSNEIKELAEKDPQMARAIEVIGNIEREGYDDIFAAIIESIVSQQLSGKVAEKIIGRLRDLLGGITPGNIISKSPEEIKSVGLSERKVKYILGVASAVTEGTLDCDALTRMSDAEVVDKLICLPGIGEWTAQMLLIFALGRKNILSYKDLGIRKGLSLLYGSDYNFDEIYLRLSPYNTLASFYLWEISARGGLN